VLLEYDTAVREPLAGHRLADFIRHDLAEHVADLAGPAFKVEGSPGKGNWAETPWVSVFEPSVTTSAQRGFYVVYLFSADGASVHLSLNQGTTEVYNAVGGRRYLDVLSDLASVDAQLLQPVAIESLRRGPLDLPGASYLTRGYNAGNIVARTYAVEDFPSNQELSQDFALFVDLYVALVDARESLNESTSEDLPDGVTPGEEARRFRWHRRTERNPRLAKQAKQFHGLTCRVCGFNFEASYGGHGAGYIEAHHLVPLAELASRPGRVTLDPRTDFTVVCANCHRMLHRAPGPSVNQLAGWVVQNPSLGSAGLIAHGSS
jgi:5-methylcytosine-specific restriction protein A